VIPVVWGRVALADMQRVRRYIADFNPCAARDMAQRILEAGNGKEVDAAANRGSAKVARECQQRNFKDCD
jgi:plasmid stabilization system protein ParE